MRKAKEQISVYYEDENVTIIELLLPCPERGYQHQR